jgi:hypothetical protein
MLLKTFWGTHWELEEPFEKILRTPWELYGYTLRIANNQHNPFK